MACTRPPGSGTRSAAQSDEINPATIGGYPAILADVEEVEVVVAHNERATLRVGDVFLKIDADQTRTDVEVEAMAIAPILCDFGVEVTRTFETAVEVYATETPGGEAAVAVHRGPYNRMNEAHNAVREWMAANRRESAGHSWEIYGDPTPDPADTQTTVVYLLKD